MEHFTPGERVEAVDPSTREWRAGYVLKDEPYARAKCGGAYVMWDLPADAPNWASRGGWQSERTIRRVVNVTIPED